MSSFRGGGGFGSRGGSRGGRGGSYNSDRGNFRSNFNANNADYAPEELQALGVVMHPCESDIVCLSTHTKVPYFNAPVFLENNNKSSIGKVDEILGPINQVYFTVKVADGIVASSLKKDTKLYIGSDKLLPLDRFLPKPKAPKTPRVKKTGFSSGSGRGGRGSGRGGRGSRGSFSGRGGSFRGGSSGRGGFGGSNRGGGNRR